MNNHLKAIILEVKILPCLSDASGGRNSSAVEENVISHISEKVVGNATLSNTQKIKKNEASSVARYDGGSNL